MAEIIDIDIGAFDPTVSSFMMDVMERCRSSGVALRLTDTSTVAVNGLECGGYFNDLPPKFVVACGRSPKTWLGVFVHESCHMDQWLESAEVWEYKIPGTDEHPSDLFDGWLNREMELDGDTKDRVVESLVNLELDCERRSADKIAKYNLPVRLDTYIRKSNAYIWSYRFMAETRDWDHGDAYTIPAVWRAMPNHFDNDYGMLPDRIRDVFIGNVRSR